MTLFFGICFILYYVKLSAGHGFWSNLRRTDAVTHKLAVKYQRSLRQLEKAQLDLNFLLNCKKHQVYPKFVRWKNISRLKKKKAQSRFLHLLLNDAVEEKRSDIKRLSTKTLELKQELSFRTTWMKFKLLIFSINRLLRADKNRITARHNRKLRTFIELKNISAGIQENPNEPIVDLTGQPLTSDELSVLKLGLRHGLATRPNQLEIM